MEVQSNLTSEKKQVKIAQQETQKKLLQQKEKKPNSQGFTKFEDEEEDEQITTTTTTIDLRKKNLKNNIKQKKARSNSISNIINGTDDHIYKIPNFHDDKKKAIKTLICVSLVCIVFMITEVVGGYLANSLAIMTDAAHLFSDVSGFFISIFSIWISSLPTDQSMTYGYSRAEIIGALGSVMLIWGLTFWLVYEAIQRIIHVPEVNPQIMLIVSCLGLFFNIVMFKVLHSSHGSHGHGHSCGHSHDHGHSHGHSHEHNHNNSESSSPEHKHNHDEENQSSQHNHEHEEAHDAQNINVRAAMIHIIGDMIQSIGVIFAALLIYWKGQSFAIADPICTFLFSVLVLFTTIPMAKESVRVLMEGVPKKINMVQFRQDLAKIEGVQKFHDLHIWSLNDKQIALSCHIVSGCPNRTLRKATELCKKYEIFHSTIQVEDYHDQNTYDHDRCKEYMNC